MKPTLPIALLALSASPLAAQTAPPPVTRPNFGPSSDMRMTSALQDLTFATAPHATNVVGLCTANVIRVHFDYPGNDRNRAETPVRAREIGAAQVYRSSAKSSPMRR